MLTKMKMGVRLSLLGLLFFGSNVVLSQNKVVVIPMFDEVKPLANVITVSTKNGDFTDPIAAMASINNASIDNPYLVIIGPGTYTLGSPLIIKAYVSVTGSGRNVTTLEAGYGAAARPDSAVVATAPLSRGNALTALTINQYGANTQISSGLYIDRSIPDIEDIDINVTSTGLVNYGMYIEAGTPTVEDVNINVRDARNSNTGIYVANLSQAKINRVTTTARGGILSVGVYADSATPILEGVRSNARDASGSSWGIYNTSNTNVSVRDGRFTTQSGNGCFVSSNSRVTFINSSIANGCSGAGSAVCLYSTNGSFGDINTSCAP